MSGGLDAGVRKAILQVRNSRNSDPPDVIVFANAVETVRDTYLVENLPFVDFLKQFQGAARMAYRSFPSITYAFTPYKNGIGLKLDPNHTTDISPEFLERHGLYLSKTDSRGNVALLAELPITDHNAPSEPKGQEQNILLL